MLSNNAIVVKGLCRGYGNTKVLEDINFEIKEGSICALLGPSGCGKTSIIRTLLGRLYPDDGKVLIFNKEPYSSIDFDYPGSLVGYAPQELALNSELTIGEVLQFYGDIHFMDRGTFKQNRDSIVALLDLPDINRIVETLSGGQKRRVSLAAALLHKPKILILDEPSVGIDIVVAKRIWDHLNYLSKNENVTVLVTTHYLEEARQADSILLLRDHKIIERGNPYELLNRYKCSLLEEVYLKVCIQQSSKIDQLEIQTPDGVSDQSSDSNNEINNTLQEISISTTTTTTTTNDNSNNNQLNNLNIFKKKLHHSYAIFKRCLLSCIRIRLLILMVILSPAILSCLFFITIGGEPHQIPFGVLNNDSGEFGSMFANELYNRPVFNIQNITSISSGINEIKDGSIYGFIEIPFNFSNGVVNRYLSPSDPPLPDSEVIPYLDKSNAQIYVRVMSNLQDIFVKLSNDSGVKLYPIQETVAVYDGSNDFTWFLGPAIIPTMIFAHIMFFMEVGLIKERNSGCLDRLYSYGVTPLSNILGYILCACFILFIQNSLLLVLGHFAFNVPVRGNIVLVYLFLYLIEMVGVYYGILFYNICKEEVESVQISLAVFFSIFFLSGTIWTVESIPSWFQWVVYLIPSSWAWDVLRGVMIKDLPFSHIHVWRPFIILLAWNIVLFVISFYTISYRDKNSNYLNRIKQFLKLNKNHNNNQS